MVKLSLVEIPQICLLLVIKGAVGVPLLVQVVRSAEGRHNEDNRIFLGAREEIGS
jgi:hypothetical protein